MPFRSHSEIQRGARRQLSNSRAVSACLIVEAPDGREIVRAGGLWSPGLGRYLAADESDTLLVPARISLQQSQAEAIESLVAWLRRAYRGERPRWPLEQLAGGRGSGKTFAAFGIFSHLVALTWPGDQSFGVNLNTDNRRECLHHMQQVAADGWLSKISTDPRDSYVEWVTGHRLTWVSAQNPKKLRQGGLPLRSVILNEAHLMPERIGADAQIACRNLGGLVVQTFNPPTHDGGNWTARLWFAVQAGEVEGRTHLMRPRDNAAIDHDYLDQAGKIVRVISPAIAAADIDGEIKIAGSIAYPSFDGRAYNHADPMQGGNVGDPAQMGWREVTREVTTSAMGGQVGADRAVGCDFQRRPGIVGNVARFYRLPPVPGGCAVCGPGGCLVMHIERQVACRGVEPEFSQALIDASLTTNGHHPNGFTAPSALLIGDATGARQNAEHRFQRVPSFLAMRADGWIIEPPSYHWKHRTPWNPAVIESLAQVFELLRTRHILISPRCKESPAPGFASLIDSFRNAPKWEHSGKLREDGGYQHGPDGVRYLAWRFMPRPKPVRTDTALDTPQFTALQGMRLFGD